MSEAAALEPASRRILAGYFTLAASTGTGSTADTAGIPDAAAAAR